eukprot:scpid86971/ scgid16457/ 
MAARYPTQAYAVRASGTQDYDDGDDSSGFSDDVSAFDAYATGGLEEEYDDASMYDDSADQVAQPRPGMSEPPDMYPGYTAYGGAGHAAENGAAARSLYPAASPANITIPTPAIRHVNVVAQQGLPPQMQWQQPQQQQQVHQVQHFQNAQQQQQQQ